MIDHASLTPSLAHDGGLDASAPAEVGWPGIRVVADVGSPVSCTVCGCVLYPDPTPASEPVWYHFAPARGRDANGCRIGCVTAAHRADGRPLDSSWA